MLSELPIPAAGLQQPGNAYEARIAVVPAQPNLPALPGSPGSPVPFARKRARTWKLNGDNAPSAARPKLSPGRPRVAHPDCTPPPDQAAGEASATSPSVQNIGDSPPLSPLGRMRGCLKGPRSSASKSPVLLSGSPSEAGALTHFREASAADGASPGSPSPRKRGRPKGSRNAPVGETLFISRSCLSCYYQLPILFLFTSSSLHCILTAEARPRELQVSACNGSVEAQTPAGQTWDCLHMCTC